MQQKQVTSTIVMHTAPIKWYIFDATSTHSWDFVSSDLFPFSCIFIIPKLSRTLVLMKSRTSTKRPIATTLSLQPPHPVHICTTTHSLSTHPQFQPKPQVATLKSLSNHRVLNFNPSPLQPNFLATHVQCSIPTKALCNKLLFQFIQSSVSTKAQVSNILYLSLFLSLFYDCVWSWNFRLL